MAAAAAVQVGARATAAVSARLRATSGAGWAVAIPASGGWEKASWVAAMTEQAALVPAPKVRARVASREMSDVTAERAVRGPPSSTRCHSSAERGSRCSPGWSSGYRGPGSKAVEHAEAEANQVGSRGVAEASEDVPLGPPEATSVVVKRAAATVAARTLPRTHTALGCSACGWCPAAAGPRTAPSRSTRARRARRCPRRPPRTRPRRSARPGRWPPRSGIDRSGPARMASPQVGRAWVM